MRSVAIHTWARGFRKSTYIYGYRIIQKTTPGFMKIRLIFEVVLFSGLKVHVIFTFLAGPELFSTFIRIIRRGGGVDKLPRFPIRIYPFPLPTYVAAVNWKMRNIREKWFIDACVPSLGCSSISVATVYPFSIHLLRQSYLTRLPKETI